MPKGHLLHDLVSRVAETRPEQLFLIEGEEEWSYGDVEASSNRVAQALISESLEVGDRVALLSENSSFYVEAYYGILKAGGITVALNTAWDAGALASVLRSCGARFLMVSSRFARVALEAVAFETKVEALILAGAGAELDDLTHPLRGILFDHAVASASSLSVDVSLSDDHVASIVYTSGSTGVPYGATLSQSNLCSNISSIAEYLELSSDDRVLAVLPFYYVYGKSVLNTHAAVGGTVVIENRFQYPSTALDTLENQRCTGFSGVPSTFAILLNRSNFAERTLPDLRYVTQAGGAMSPQLTHRLMEALPDKKIFIMYGATEASARLSYLP
ncbi:AMP-binding protein, partial [Myxococcota bacterium]|nr:AMP-binding protein [Myxococcota bacterium]